MKVLAFGEILWDLIEGKAYLGGAPLNFSVHARQLGVKSSIISAVGNDDLGKKAIDEIASREVYTDLIQVKNDKPTGTVPVTLQEGQPEYEILKNVAFDFISLAELDLAELVKYDAFYFGTLIQRSESNTEVLQKILKTASFKHIFCDVNLRKECYSKATVLNSLKYCTIVKLNEEEVDVISEMIFGSKKNLAEFAESLFQNFKQIDALIVTMGSKGSRIISTNSDVLIPAESIVVVDAIGAGDSFSAAFLTSFMTNQNLEEAAKFANKVGAFVASCSGATPVLPKELIDYQ